MPPLDSADVHRVSVAAQPSVLRSGESLTGEPLRFIGKEMWLKLAGDGTPGSLSILEDVSPPHHGPPLHKHAFDEYFYVLAGRFVFEVDGVKVEAGPGDFVFAPADVPHVFQNITDAPGRMLVLARPGGVEHYFSALAALSMSDPGNVAALSAIAPAYGVTVLGPPMAARAKMPAN
jgi:quercetin dioxygenase-like cupin family protein